MEREAEVVLFVGGPADGKRMAIPKGAMRWRVADLSKMEPVSTVKMNEGAPAYALEIEHADYDRSFIALCDGGDYVGFMMHSALQVRDALRMLIDRYKR
jgi:hypothetical protein